MLERLWVKWNEMKWMNGWTNEPTVGVTNHRAPMYDSIAFKISSFANPWWTPSKEKRAPLKIRFAMQREQAQLCSGILLAISETHSLGRPTDALFVYYWLCNAPPFLLRLLLLLLSASSSSSFFVDIFLRLNPGTSHCVNIERVYLIFSHHGWCMGFIIVLIAFVLLPIDLITYKYPRM